MVKLFDQKLLNYAKYEHSNPLPLMICPQCTGDSVKVIDSRDALAEPAVRRRRECESCGFRFTTYERLEAPLLKITKKDGRREPFDRSKLSRGIGRACEKRPIAAAELEALITRIEAELHGLGESEIPTEVLGEHVMQSLKGFDDIAYIRFASVYREFADLGELQAEVAKTLKTLNRPSRAAPQGEPTPRATLAKEPTTQTKLTV